MLSFEYRQFLNEKIMDYLPPNSVKVGDKINMRCPLCGDSKKSSTKKRGWWYNQTASYYCFNCSTGLSGIKFIQYLSGRDYAEIKKEYTKLFLKSGQNTSLSATYNIPSAEPSILEIKSVVKPEWKQQLTEDAKQYLHKRLIDVAPFYTGDMYSWISKRGKDFILISWKLNGVDSYFQINDFKKHGSLKYIFPKDLKKTVYGLDNIDVTWPYIIVFEGVYDSLFVKNGIATGTKSITEYQLKLIQSHYPKHQLVIAFDNDVSGMKAIKKLIEAENDYKFFKWFDIKTKQKDINESVLFNNDVNMYSDSSKLEQMIVNKLKMKMYLIQNSFWKDEQQNTNTIKNDTSSSWKTRKIF